MSTALICGLIQSQAWGDPAHPAGVESAGPSQIAPADRDKVLGKGWKASTDRAWTTSGDATGFHVLIADQKTGYGWRTAATLAEPGFDADMWIGNACVTGSGKRAVVAYAPRTFTNKPELMARGAFTAVVDLESGAVTKLDRQASLAYFSPGCGTGETAVLTQAGGGTKNQTRLLSVDVAAAKVSRTTELAGQVTSAIPVGKDIVAADSARLTRIDEQGHRTTLARTNQVPFGLKADAEGGLVYMDRPVGSKVQGEVKRITAGDIAGGNADKAKQTVLARGTLTKMDVSSSAGGAIFITGETKAADPLPKTVQRRPDAPKDSTASTSGKALVTNVATVGDSDPRKQQDLAAESKKISLKVLATGKEAAFSVTPATPDPKASAGTAPSPALPGPKTATPSAQKSVAQPAAMAASPAEDERYCSVARNDPAKQAMQPKPRQVEWAVDQIVNGTLDKNVSRPANWKNLGMAAYQPQTLFPRLGLNGGGRIPAQVLLGVTAQESNMWQASRVVVPGVTGNPLIGNYYGIKYAASGQQTDPWAINWSNADCGYGVTQITDGMRMHGKEKPGEVATLTNLQQEAAALDYTANIAAGQRVLADKWNVTNADGLKVNNGDPKYLENWFFALWAYNSGYYPKSAAASNGGLWGVGFTNNPANPLWKANRAPFLEGPAGANDYSHAKHPQDWPYQEKVLGWAARPVEGLESPGKMVAGFIAAWWTSPALRSTVKPAENLFCTTANSCDPSKIGPNDQNEPGLGACTRSDLKCWWNQPVTWKDCGTKAECGNELIRFNDTYKEEADGTAYPPNCTTQGVPSDALIVDDVADGTPISRPGCSLPKPTSGSFSLDFATPSAKIDFQQLGAGYGGHFWFAHSRAAGADGDRMKVTGTWKVAQPQQGQHEVFVHLPDHGAQATNVQYEIETGSDTKYRVIDQKGTGNRWVSLGYWDFSDRMEVRLTSVAPSGTGDLDVAFDAVAFARSNYNTVPEINIPEPNPNAPDPDIYAQIPKEYNLNSGPSLLRSDTGTSCTAKVAGKYSCISFAPSTLKADNPTTAPNRAAAAIPLSRCHSISTDVSITRFDGCLKRDIRLEVWSDNGGTPGAPVMLLGTAFFHMVQQIEIPNNSPQSTGFSNWFGNKIYLQLFGLQGQVPTVTATAFTTECNSPVCSYKQGTWQGGATWTGPLDNHWASNYKTVRWTNDTAGAKDRFDLNETVDFVIPGARPVTQGTWSTMPMGSIVCDRIVTSVGCAMGGYIPTWNADDQKYPAAAAYYWVMREKMATHPGSEANKSPLHREADKVKRDENRARTCDRGIKAKLEAWTAAPLAQGDPTVQCDEFPFASTKESGGAVYQNGKPCVQLYAKQVGAKWKLFADGRYDPLPSGTWHQICGRASMPGLQNMDAGRTGLSPFYTAMRVLDNDPFYFRSPRYERCNTSTVCTV